MQPHAEPLAALRAAVAASAAVRRYSDDQLELLYSLAYRHYRQGEFVVAARYFSHLALYRPLSEPILKGLAGSQFMARHFDRAAVIYAFLLQLAPDDVETCCLYGHSLLLLGEYADACAALRVAGQRDGPFAQRARALLELMRRPSV